MLRGLDSRRVPASKSIQNKPLKNKDTGSFASKSKRLSIPLGSDFLGGNGLQFNECVNNPYHLKSVRTDASKLTTMVSPNDKDMEYDW